MEKISRRKREYPGTICGLKVRISKNIVGDLGIKPLINAVKMGDALGLRVCVHTTNPPVNASEVAEILRAGDIFSHTFHKKGMSIISSDAIPATYHNENIMWDISRVMSKFLGNTRSGKLGIIPEVVILKGQKVFSRA